MAPKFCAQLQGIDKLANQAGMYIEDSVDGMKVIRNRSTREVLASKGTEAEARAFLKDLVDGNAANLDASFPFPARGEAMGSNAPPIGAQLTPLRRAIKGLQIGVLARITPIGQFARSLQALKGYPAWSKIVEPTQNARQRIAQLYANKKMPGLKTAKHPEGITFQQAIHGLSLRIAKAKLDREQQRLITLLPEAFTREEIARPGVLLARGMSPEEISFAEKIAELGFAEDIPSIIRRNAVIEGMLRNRPTMLEKTVPQLRTAIQEGKLPEGLLPDIERMVASAGDERSLTDMYKTLGLSDDEIFVSGFVKVATDTEGFNLPAIYRYAAAPEAKPGFKNGWDQFVAERGVLPITEQLARERVDILREAFKDTEFDLSQTAFAQLPVFRRFIDAGLWSGKQWGRSVAGMPEGRALNALNSLEEGSELFSRRVLSGHINPRELDPVTTLNRHIENLFFRQELDPLLPGARDAANTIFNEFDERAGKFLLDYLHEVQGLPGGNFEAINAALRTTVRGLGIDVDERVGEKWINTLVKISSQAAIPFRAGLVARNGLQSPLFTGPVLGGESWYVGLKAALGAVDGGTFSLDAMKKAIDRAVKAGAIDPNVLPIHASSEIFGANLETLSRVNLKVQDLFDLGFSFYRTPDDLGRVVAFEGMRHRFNKHVGDFLNGVIDEKTFMSRSRVSTFDEVIIDEGMQMLRAGDPKASADFFGKHLADKTHLLYANANHPPGWGGVTGRLFGQYGTFPVQYLNYLVENSTKNIGSREWAEFVTLHTGMNMGIVLAGAELFDADLTSWATFGSLTYTGGPYAEAAVSLFQAWGGSDAERSLAIRNLQMMFPSFNSPQSVFVPGSYFIGDFVDAFQESDPVRSFGEGTGIRFLRPREDTWPQKALGWIGEISP